MEKIQLTKTFYQSYLKGNQLITQNDLMNASYKEGFGSFYYQHQFLGNGYLGKENRGLGWLLTYDDQDINQEFFESNFNKAKLEREFYFQHLDDTNAFRVFNGIADGIGGITIDYYDNNLVLSLYNEIIQTKLSEILSALENVYNDINNIFVKYRYQKAKVESEWVVNHNSCDSVLIKENSINYQTYLNEGLMTGIFLDQRHIRKKLVDGLACGQNVLNLFSYTGAFSVAAAMGGAYQTTSVDLAKRSLPKTKEMFECNHLNPDDHHIVVMDVFDFCKFAKRKGYQYDVIILDPPSFARNGKKTWSVAKDYGKLIEAISPLLKENSLCIVSTNASNVSIPQFKQMIEKSFIKEHKKFKQISLDKLEPDFKTVDTYPVGDYLKVITYQTEK